MQKAAFSARLSLIVAIFLLVPTTAYAWGERGHQIVSRVAARLVAQKEDAEVAAVFRRKELMLAHLSNVPDTVWRNLGGATEVLNGPTHYMNLELLDPKPSWVTLVRDKAAAESAMLALCALPRDGYICSPKTADEPDGKTRLQHAGTAAWRVGQLQGLARAAFSDAAPSGEGGVTEHVDRALLHLGLMAHFVGDLSQPLHATRDYDGWESGLGGSHSYFESDVVDAFDLSLEQDVLRAATAGLHKKRVLTIIPAKDRKELSRGGVDVAFALTLDSFSRLATLRALDREHAVTKPSSDVKGLRIRAERRPAAATSRAFRDLIVERLATGAELLAHLWLMTYADGGKPPLRDYKSFAYPMTPAFIAPSAIVK